MQWSKTPHTVPVLSPWCRSAGGQRWRKRTRLMTGKCPSLGTQTISLSFSNEGFSFLKSLPKRTDFIADIFCHVKMKGSKKNSATLNSEVFRFETNSDGNRAYYSTSTREPGPAGHQGSAGWWGMGLWRGQNKDNTVVRAELGTVRGMGELVGRAPSQV